MVCWRGVTGAARRMFDWALKSGRRAEGGIARATSRGSALWACLLLLLSLAGAGRAAANSEANYTPVPAARTGLPFAVADFDGDLRPDLASVESGANQSGSTNYSIQLHLSAAGGQSIQLIAPAGGLFIEARDVNGDNAVDLVVSSAYFGRPVAVLLNDGHGSFSQAAPSDFPGAFSSSKAFEAVSSAQLADAGGLPPQPRLPVCSDGSLYDARHCAARICGPRFAFVSNLLSSSLHGRAPPSKLLHS